ncbi:MAG TPA: urate oxidase [Candidatus Didemnitutus sp.]|nr:urate oxidase [Candidatus Didemnitutus sp.]
MKLVSQNYGKQRVRVMKVLRAGPRHEVKEVEFGVRLEGDFETSYTAGDNSKVVPTDTMKNTVHALAHHQLALQTEPFAVHLAQHFLKAYDQVARVTIDTTERRWARLDVGGRGHDHTFLAQGGSPVVRVVAARGGATEVESGIEDLLVMKSTGSGFKGYPKCGYTILPETTDRILATSMRATWRWSAPPRRDYDCNATNTAILAAMLAVFANNYSPSVQTTLYEMAGAALAACPLIASVSLAMPNKHYLPANLKPFGIDATGVSFVPTDEPHGQIEATVAR